MMLILEKLTALVVVGEPSVDVHVDVDGEMRYWTCRWPAMRKQKMIWMNKDTFENLKRSFINWNV